MSLIQKSTFVFICIIVTGVFVYAGEPSNQSREQNGSKGIDLDQLDSQLEALSESIEVDNEAIYEKQMEQSMNQYARGLDIFMAKQKEQQAKRKRWNIIRGVLLVVTIIASIGSLMAKSKAKELAAKTNSEATDDESQSE
ncbi:MAG: hypothetical protein ACI9JN_000801 [Bacteroidia bacterium]|jgi:hypothetical protein